MKRMNLPIAGRRYKSLPVYNTKTRNKIAHNQFGKMIERDKYMKVGSKPHTAMTRNVWMKLTSISRKHRIIVYAVILVVTICLFRLLRYILIRPHSIRGGLLGPSIDNMHRGFIKNKQLKELQKSVPEIIYGDEFYQNHDKMKNWKGESQLILDSMCESRDNDLSGTTITKVNSHMIGIPRFLIQVRDENSSAFDDQDHHWDQSFYTKITVSDLQMRYQMRDLFFPEKKLHELYKSISIWDNKVILWKICALYWYGGVFIAENAIALEVNYPSSIQDDESSDILNCQQSILYAVIEGNEVQERSASMNFLAATPRNRIVLDLLEYIVTILRKKPNAELKSQISHILYSLIVGNQRKQLEGDPDLQNSIESIKTLSETCVECNENTVDETCCDIVLNENVLFHLRKKNREEEDISTKPGTFSLHVGKNTKEYALNEKEPIQSQLIKTNCEPSFLCNRCLRFGKYGTFGKCKGYCSKCYIDTICQPRSIDRKIELDLIPNKPDDTETDTQKKKKLIPRIIHQTWFEDISPHKYPDLVRLQNSWKVNKGWEYRFYDDESARAFIEHHFPSRFLLAYDSIIPGAYKADLFRYLVLLIHGGIYADIDVILETNLDDFITPEMAFFVPRDVVPFGEEYCLWNGFVGSSPGHPIIVKAVERAINLILNKADMFDMERVACASSGLDMAIWKLRFEPGLLITGPCSLGIAMNEALGNEGLKKIDLGWTKLDGDRHLRGFVNGKAGGGDTLILSVSVVSD